MGVSLDKDHNKWTKAIQQDKLTWPQAYDSLAFNSPVAKVYDINSIPANYLLDPQGNIIGRDISPDSLIKKLTIITKNDKRE